MASHTAQREKVKKHAKLGDVGRKLAAGSIADENADDELVDMSAVERGERERGCQSNDYAVQLGIIHLHRRLRFLDRVRTPSSYDDNESPNEETYIPEDRSTRIRQLFTLLLGIAIGVSLCRHYIEGQSKHTPSSALVILEFICVILYMAIWGLFLCLVLLRFTYPWIERLGNYARHGSGSWMEKVLATLGVLAIFGVCVVLLFAFPLIPVVGGVIARKSRDDGIGNFLVLSVGSGGEV